MTPWGNHKTCVATILWGFALFIASPAEAQTIQIDGSTPTLAGGTTACSGTCAITGGTQAGRNLFHSFQHFGVDTDATVTFIDPGVQNIITRITGDNASLIDGLLQTSANSMANLFLFNPNGVIFGESASLQIGGSFIASTASGLQFEDGNFSLTDNSAANSLLTVNIPLGLQVGANAGDIVVEGHGNQLFINPDLSVVDFLAAPDLQVNQQTLALVGNNVILDGANLVAPGGRIELGGVDDGLVRLKPVSTGFQLNYDNVNSFGDITLENAAALKVSNFSAGNVQLQGQLVSLTGGSAILANTLGSGSGGLVQVNAESLTLEGASSFVPVFIPPMFADFVVMPSGIFASVGSGASGDGSHIDLNVAQLTLTAGAQIAASTFGDGSAGTLTVTAETIAVDGGRPAGPSGLFTTVAPGPNGGPDGSATGNGGSLTIDADVLSIIDGGQISAGTFGAGHAGNLIVKADQVEIVGSFGTPGAGGPSSLRSASERPWSGNGGELMVNTQRLLVADGGQVVTGTLSPNPAGDLIIQALEQVELRGGDAFGQSGLFASALLGPGSGGNVMVETGNLNLQDGATINVSNKPSTPGSSLTEGTGPAGNLAIKAENILLDNGSSFSADTVDGNNANIGINARTLTLRDSTIKTNASGTAPGGNITATLDTLTMLGDSSITANSENSNGGRVSITTEALLQSSDSLITATSALGSEFDGIVEINSPDLPPNNNQKHTESPADTQQIITACEQLTENELVVTGQGGLPTDPTQILTGQDLWADIRSLGNVDTASEFVSVHARPIETQAPNQLNRAQGLVRNEQGQLMLVAQTTQINYPTSAFGQQTLPCQRG
ncbi:filamentous hemagglutinin N-terminal domain-containing protein [Leptothoe sp. EHU-05/26/07-4]